MDGVTGPPNDRLEKDKKVVTIHVIKACRVSGDMAQIVLNLRTKCSLNVKRYRFCIGENSRIKKKINFVVYCSVAAVLVLTLVNLQKCVG